MNSDTFQFKVANDIDKPAIWLELHEREVMVFPFELYNILFDCSRERWICRDVKAHFQIFSEEVCGYFFDASYGSYQRTYQRSAFIKSAIQSLKDLCEAVVHGDETAYQNIKHRAAEQMLVGLKDIIIPQSYIQIREDEVKIEPFEFGFIEPYSCDTNYVIGIGDREYKSALSDWSTDFNLIRMGIEKYLLSNDDESEIELYFEDSPTIIRLKNISLMHSNKKATRVAIIPNSFVHEPVLYGWCDQKQLIKALYVGLLHICIRESGWFAENLKDWEGFRLTTYNELESLIIERFLMDQIAYVYEPLPRHRFIDSIEEMIADYGFIDK